MFCILIRAYINNEVKTYGVETYLLSHTRNHVVSNIVSSAVRPKTIIDIGLQILIIYILNQLHHKLILQ